MDFNLTLVPVIRALLIAGGGYELAGKAYNNLVYADDSAPVANSPERMAALLIAAEPTAAAVDLHFNPAKCAKLHLKGRDAAAGSAAGPVYASSGGR